MLDIVGSLVNGAEIHFAMPEVLKGGLPLALQVNNNNKNFRAVISFLLFEF